MSATPQQEAVHALNEISRYILERLPGHAHYMVDVLERVFALVRDCSDTDIRWNVQYCNRVPCIERLHPVGQYTDIVIGEDGVIFIGASGGFDSRLPCWCHSKGAQTDPAVLAAKIMLHLLPELAREWPLLYDIASTCVLKCHH